MANIITVCRIVCGLSLLFFPTFSTCFYGLYIAGGLTDAVDGAVARKTNSASAFGSKLDTIADLVFFCAAFLKILTSVHIPKLLLVWIILIALIKISSIIYGFVRLKSFVAEHSALNKITGVLVFILPLCVGILKRQYVMAISCAVCIIASFAAICEWHNIRT